PKLTALEFRDSLGAQVEHDFVMRLQRLAEPREVEHDGAICHRNRPFIHAPNPRWPLSGTPERAFSLQRADPSRLGRRARSLGCCRGPFKAGLCRVGRDDRRQSQVREVYVINRVYRYGRRKSRTVDMLELRLRLNLRYWAKYPEGCRFAGIGAGGDEKPVEFGNK